jgi:biotin transport system substrate-specific component
MNVLSRLFKVKVEEKQNSLARDLFQVFLASFALSLISLFKVPLYPTPMTFQTCGVFLIGLLLTPKKAALAVSIYLIEATFGLPVLSGGTSNPLWMVAPNAGFLASFPLAAFVVSFLVRRFKSPSFIKTSLCALAGKVVVYLCGLIVLSFFFGFKSALQYGVTPFLFVFPIKIFLVSFVYKLMNFLRNSNT